MSATDFQFQRAMAGIRRYLDAVAQLAYEFVAAYRALRESIGDAAALADRSVQAARRAWMAVRNGEQVSA